MILIPSENKYKLVNNYVYQDCIVPRGFETDGTTAPTIFRLFVPKFAPKYIRAVVVHDYLCSEKEYQKADRYFKDMLYTIDKNWKTRLMANAVKYYTKFIRSS